jgi:hypothetical protein
MSKFKSTTEISEGDGGTVSVSYPSGRIESRLWTSNSGLEMFRVSMDGSLLLMGEVGKSETVRWYGSPAPMRK